MMRALPLLAIIAGPVSIASRDPTAAALESCLDLPAQASTAGQTDCESQATQSYDRRMNFAYRALLKILPAASAQRLRVAQRSWLSFRTADRAARFALFESRQGTMYVPMHAHAETEVVRDRALQLESYLRVMRIEG